MNEEERRAAGRRREDRRKPEQAANWYAKNFLGEIVVRANVDPGAMQIKLASNN